MDPQIATHRVTIADLKLIQERLQSILFRSFMPQTKDAFTRASKILADEEAFLQRDIFRLQYNQTVCRMSSRPPLQELAANWQGVVGM